MTYNRNIPHPNQQGGQAFNRRPFPSQPVPDFFKDYLIKGYFDEKGNLLEQVITKWPKDCVDSFANGIPRLSTSQLRKFYDEVKLIEGQLKAGKTFDSLKSKISKLDAYADESVKKRKAPLVFKTFMERNLKWATKDLKSFIEGFVQHFECIVLYYPETR